ncbi:MAG: transporter [Endomicrobia bacterium]|nr:transporter [Endomicrobiia bacterium]MDW8055647.1 transporter [Elusimicrobiota bacterium]
MKLGIKTVYSLIFNLILLNVIQAQINFFNIYRPFQSTLCCPVNVYGLMLEMNYYLIGSNKAELKIPVGLYWGATDSLEVGFEIAGVSRSERDDVDKGISDMLIGIKHLITKEQNGSVNIPTISAELGFSLPTGNYKEKFGTGGIGIIVLWMIDKEVILKTQHWFNLTINLGYRYYTRNPDKYKVGDSFFYTFGSNFQLTDELKVSFGLKGENKKNDEENSSKILNTEKFESYISSGISYDIDEYRRFFTGLSFGITKDAKNLVFNIGMMY